MQTAVHYFISSDVHLGTEPVVSKRVRTKHMYVLETTGGSETTGAGTAASKSHTRFDSRWVQGGHGSRAVGAAPRLGPPMRGVQHAAADAARARDAALLMLLERRALLGARAAVLSNASGPDPLPISSETRVI